MPIKITNPEIRMLCQRLSFSRKQFYRHPNLHRAAYHGIMIELGEALNKEYGEGWAELDVDKCMIGTLAERNAAIMNSPLKAALEQIAGL